MKTQFLFFCILLASNFLFAQKIGQVTQGLSVLESSTWPNKTCNVCWENPSASNATERGWVKDAVSSTWEKESNFRFTGWGPCNAKSRGIRILIDDSHPHTATLGSALDGMVNGMFLNFTYNLWTGCEGNSTNCECRNSPEGRKRCIQVIAVHEFGHALGFAHEQNRTDAPLLCQTDAQGGNGDWWITPYDAESIMNYCNPKWNNDGFLSDRDKYGVRLLYGGAIIEAPIIYATDKNKNLLWYKHTGYLNGSFDWASNNGAKVGTGWDFVQIFNGGDGFIYALKTNGDLVWYNHNGYHDGRFNWSQASGHIVGKGWNKDIQAAFAGGNGIIYLIKNNGDLLWYKHLGYKDGSFTWDKKSGTKVGSGWTNFYAAFSGGNGVIYVIAKNGDLYWYKHAGYNTGTNLWYGGTTNKIGTGWNSAAKVFSTGWGIIYLVDRSGKLRYYNHMGFINGSSTWRNGSGNIVGTGWSDVNTIGMGSINPSKFNLTPLEKIRNEPTILKAILKQKNKF